MPISGKSGCIGCGGGGKHGCCNSLARLVERTKGDRSTDWSAVMESVVWPAPAPALLLLHRQVENPEKKQTEHWMAIAPSDLRSKVAARCKIMPDTTPNHQKTMATTLSRHSLRTVALFQRDATTSVLQNKAAISLSAFEWLCGRQEKESSCAQQLLLRALLSHSAALPPPLLLLER